MATATVGTTATAIDDGSSGYVAIVNTGAIQATVTRGADATVLWPGSRLVVTPGGVPVTARTVSGQTELTYTTGVADSGQRGSGGVALDDFAADVVAALAAKAPLASPALTGNPTVPTQTAGNSSTRVASTAFVGAAVAAQAVVDSGTYAAKAGAATVSGAWTFTVLPQAHDAAGEATPIYARTSADGITVGAWNLVHDGVAGDFLHITTGPNSVSNANGCCIAIGVDYAATGMAIRNKSTGQGLILDHLATVSSSTSYALQVRHNASAAACTQWLMGTTAGTAPMMRWTPASAGNNPANSVYLYVNDNAATPFAGRIMADTGIIDWARTIQAVAPTAAAAPIIRVADEVAASPSEVWMAAKTTGDTGLRIYRWSGSSNLVYAHALLGSSDELQWQCGNGAQVKGSHTTNVAMRVRAHSTGPRIGLYNTTPVAQQTRAGALTDSSGGTSGGSTIAAVTDVATAANAVATLAARLNSIEAKLSAAAGGIGVTA